MLTDIVAVNFGTISFVKRGSLAFSRNLDNILRLISLAKGKMNAIIGCAMTGKANRINFNANFWLGGTDLGHEGTWIWISSIQPVEDFVWYKDALGEPHESVNDNCMAWYRNRGFDKARNYPCSDSHYPLCQILV